MAPLPLEATSASGKPPPHLPPGVRQRLAWMQARWHALLLVVVLLLGTALAAWQHAVLERAGGDRAACLALAFAADITPQRQPALGPPPDDPELAVPRSWPQRSAALTACEDELLQWVRSVDPLAHPGSCRPGGGNAAVCVLREPGWPRIHFWVDNLFADLLALFLVAAFARCGRTLPPPARGRAPRARLLLWASAAVCVAAAVFDHAENFWLLANIGEPVIYRRELDLVAWIGAWKWRLYGGELLLLAAWLGAAAWAARRAAAACEPPPAPAAAAAQAAAAAPPASAPPVTGDEAPVHPLPVS